MEPCHVENNTNNGLSSEASMSLILAVTIIFTKTSQKSKTRVGYIIFHNNGFAALRDRNKVFRLSKNTFQGNFSFIANWKWNFSSFFYSKQTFLAPKSIILAWARVSENWQPAADYRKWSSLGNELTVFIDWILLKLLFQWVEKRFNQH